MLLRLPVTFVALSIHDTQQYFNENMKHQCLSVCTGDNFSFKYPQHLPHMWHGTYLKSNLHSQHNSAARNLPTRMYNSQETYHQVLKDIATLVQREPHSSRTAETTACLSDVYPPTPSTVERTLDWKAFLKHPRFDHDTTVWLFCNTHFERDTA
jgi:hypothetical protein